MKRTILIPTVIAGVYLLLLVLAAACQSAGAEEPAVETTTEGEAAPAEDPVKRGAYLVAAVGCHDCHSPKIMGPKGPELDQELLLSGYPAERPLPEVALDAIGPGKWTLFNDDLTAAVGPWGVSFAANLTSDPTGIGNWTETQFLKAIREGKFKGLDNSRPLLPPMPWPAYRNLSDEDLKAIFAYLKTTKAVRNIVPAPIPPDQIAKQG